MNKKELTKRIGCIEQLGGIREFTFTSGKAKGVRAIEIDTGNLCFTILPDRCMDISYAKYKGKAISWMSNVGIVAPEYYEKDGKNWLRSFSGGLITTCGLKNIGGPVGEQGLHGRIANTPADKVSIFADWIEDEYVMKVSGQMRESCVFGENLVLKRTITAKLFCDEITVDDIIVNEGFREENIALCYHCNFGYPFVNEDSKIINVPSEFARISAPIHGAKEECIAVDYLEDMITVGIENEAMGAYITYNRDTLPDFLIWKMLGESEYVIGLEPRTTAVGGGRIAENNAYVALKPFEKYSTQLRFEIKEK